MSGKLGNFASLCCPLRTSGEPLPLAKFVHDLQAVDTDALGAPVTNFQYMETIKEGYSKASVYAVSGIVFLTFLMFRGALSTILALVPLLVGSVWTLGMMVLFGVQFNMANLLFIPLIIGIGIDNGVHIVHSYRATGKFEGESIPLTKRSLPGHHSRGANDHCWLRSLMISSHGGIYSLGLLVALGVGSVLIASLTTLPSLLAILGSAAGGHMTPSRTYQETAISRCQSAFTPERQRPTASQMTIWSWMVEGGEVDVSSTEATGRNSASGALALVLLIDLNRAHPAFGAGPRTMCRRP